MANRKKPEGEKLNKPMFVYINENLKTALDQMAEETGISNSERARVCLERQVQEWQAQRGA